MLDYHSFDFDLAGLSSTGKHWTVTIPAALLRDATVGAVDAIDVECSDACWAGSLLRTADSFHMEVSFSLRIKRRCDRCLNMFDWSLAEENERDFSFGSDVESKDEDDLEVIDFLAPPGRLNLVDLLREEIWLAWRSVLVCDETCKGVTAESPLNNVDRKDLIHDNNHPFAVLKKLK